MDCIAPGVDIELHRPLCGLSVLVGNPLRKIYSHGGEDNFKTDVGK
jgi:hypothetical protein